MMIEARTPSGGLVDVQANDDGQLILSDAAEGSGGASPHSFLSTAAVYAALVKAGDGKILSMEFFNVSANAVYVRLYDHVDSPVAGDTADIKWRGIVPGNTTGAGFVVSWPKGLTFAVGIGIRVTGAVADNDNTSLSANTVMGNVEYL